MRYFFWGLLISSATTWIYYAYEGFRLPWLTYLSRKVNARRLSKCQKAVTEALRDRLFDHLTSEEQDRVSVAYEVLLDYPKLGRPNEAEFVMDRPTRLGNIIATYERYPESRYGFDGVFYWFHLLSLAPAEARKEFDDQYALSQSLVITSFAGAVIALVHLVTLAALVTGSLFERFDLVTLPAPISVRVSGVLLLVGVAVLWLFYLLALPAHRELGKIFRAIVDITAPRLIQWIRSVQVPPRSDVAVDAAVLHEYLVALRTPPNT